MYANNVLRFLVSIFLAAAADRNNSSVDSSRVNTFTQNQFHLHMSRNSKMQMEIIRS